LAAKADAARAQRSADQAAGLANKAQTTADTANNRINGLDDFDNLKTVTVYFKTGSSILGPKAKEAIEEAAEWVKTQNTNGWVVAVVGYAAGGLAGGLLAGLVAFTPSFLFVVAGAPHFQRLRASRVVQSFLDGAGPAAIGAIAGSSVVLGMALGHLWQGGVLALAAVWLLALRRGVVSTLLGAGLLGVGAALLGLPIGG